MGSKGGSHGERRRKLRRLLRAILCWASIHHFTPLYGQGRGTAGSGRYGLVWTCVHCGAEA